MIFRRKQLCRVRVDGWEIGQYSTVREAEAAVRALKAGYWVLEEQHRGVWIVSTMGIAH